MQLRFFVGSRIQDRKTVLRMKRFHMHIALYLSVLGMLSKWGRKLCAKGATYALRGFSPKSTLCGGTIDVISKF